MRKEALIEMQERQKPLLGGEIDEFKTDATPPLNQQN